MITKDELIIALNRDIMDEYAAAIQYIQHAAAITGAEYQSIQKELIVHANQEINHAIMLSEQIDYIGGIPTTEVSMRSISEDSAIMLEQDLHLEQRAIKFYQERIRQANELELWGLAQVLLTIQSEEEEHERDLLFALGK